MKHTLLITGAAGYVGAMLVNEFAKREDVERIIGLDREPLPDFIKGVGKLTYVQANTEDETWQDEVGAYLPDIVIHTAWDIRAVYGNLQATWRSNIEGSDNVFAFAFSRASVKRLIHFSTVASYGSLATNTVNYRFTEEDPFRKTDYLYAEEKRIAEEHLRNAYESSDKRVSVAIVRPAAITGPRGRFMRIRFGLQSALSGQLSGARIYSLIKALVAFVPVTPKWVRQFIHEDDVAGIVERLSFGESAGRYEVFNICPPGEAVFGKDMARAVGKRMLPIHPLLVRVAFFFFWHISRGKVPTARGAWKGYSFPIVVDGSKVTRKLGYQYQYGSFDAFYYTDGKYSYAVPEEARRHKVPQKKAVVTGGAGFIGSHVCRALLAEGYEVHVVDNLVNGKREDVPKDAQFHELDIRSTKSLQQVMDKADVIFHFAALPRVTFSIDHPIESHEANIDGTMSVLMAARDAGVRRLVYAGSSSSYGDQDSLPFTEDMAVRPVSLYAFQKYAGEELMRLFSLLYGMQTVTLRFFSVYGPGMRPDGAYALALPKFIACRKEGTPLPITGDGSQTRDFTHVKDVVRACLLAATHGNVGKGEVINIAAGRNVSINELADLVGGEKEYVARRQGDAKDTYGDNRKAQKMLGWEPSVRLEDGVAELLRENGL